MGKEKFVEVHIRRDIGTDDMARQGIADNISDMTGGIKKKKEDRIGDPAQTVRFYYFRKNDPTVHDCRVPGNWLERPRVK